MRKLNTSTCTVYHRNKIPIISRRQLIVITIDCVYDKVLYAARINVQQFAKYLYIFLSNNIKCALIDDQREQLPSTLQSKGCDINRMTIYDKDPFYYTLS